MPALLQCASDLLGPLPDVANLAGQLAELATRFANLLTEPREVDLDLGRKRYAEDLALPLKRAAPKQCTSGDADCAAVSIEIPIVAARAPRSPPCG
jgi:hypothetical protein